MSMLCCGSGRAKGFGGPLAPADSMADAEGEGGGRTTPDECESLACRRVDRDAASDVPRGDPDSAVALPPSEGSSGICTLSRGRAGPPTRKLFVRKGGVNVVSGIEAVRGLASVPVLDR
jgi:hypothetical protein